jgi:hypothetical protein
MEDTAMTRLANGGWGVALLAECGAVAVSFALLALALLAAV